MSDDIPLEDLVISTIKFQLLPENPDRVAYTVLRELYLSKVAVWLSELTSSAEANVEWNQRMVAADKQKLEIESWIRPPLKPMSLEATLETIQRVSPEVASELIKRVGKYGRRGQPISKRHLAVRALDLKCASPAMSYREVTDILCPCGNEAHTASCREQMRQQIKGLVKLLKKYGHDFTWEHVGEWKESS